MQIFPPRLLLASHSSRLLFARPENSSTLSRSCALFSHSLHEWNATEWGKCLVGGLCLASFGSSRTRLGSDIQINIMNERTVCSATPPTVCSASSFTFTEWLCQIFVSLYSVAHQPRVSHSRWARGLYLQKKQLFPPLSPPLNVNERFG